MKEWVDEWMSEWMNEWKQINKTIENKQTNKKNIINRELKQNNTNGTLPSSRSHG